MGIRLTGVHLGYMGLDYDLLLHPHPEHILHTGLTQMHKIWYQCPSLGYIVDHPDGRVLWNTGISPEWSHEWLPEWRWLIDLQAVTPETCLEARLSSLGLGPEDFRYVVQGHLHTDHAGGLRLFEQAGATVLVHEDEFNHVAKIASAENFFNRQDWSFMFERKPTLLYADQEILKGVRVVSLPGHTPGTTGLLVQLEHTGAVLLTDDAMYTHETYGPPAVGTPNTWDVQCWNASIEKIRKLATEHSAFLFPGHDETGIKVRDQHATEFKKIEFHPFSPGYFYE
jgi:glyoxylase-like metal-dependent hydrolase (beta-lactamase superfamily II)